MRDFEANGERIRSPCCFSMQLDVSCSEEGMNNFYSNFTVQRNVLHSSARDGKNMEAEFRKRRERRPEMHAERWRDREKEREMEREKER